MKPNSFDVGKKPNQIPLIGFFGKLAFIDDIANLPIFSALVSTVNNKANTTDVNTALATKADASASNGYTIANASEVSRLVLGNEIVANNFTPSGVWELLPDAALTVVDISTNNVISSVVANETTLTADTLVIESMFIRSSATLTVQANLQIAAQKTINFN